MGSHTGRSHQRYVCVRVCVSEFTTAADKLFQFMVADNKEGATLDSILTQLQDPLLPVRAHALMLLKKLVLAKVS